MPVMSVEAIPGLEGRHTWDGALTFNDRVAWPRFKLDHIAGLHSRADGHMQTEAAIGRMGEVPRQSFLEGKTVTFEGRVQGRDLDELRLGAGQILAAFAPTDEREIVSAQHPDYGPDSFRWAARCLSVELAERQDHGRFERAFAVAVRQSDPRYYAMSESSAETQAFATVAGITLPFTLPITLPAAAASGAVTIQVEGSAPAEPILELHGPVTGPRVTNQTLGLELRFTPGFSIASGQHVVVDFAERRVTLGATVITAQPDLVASSWWDAGSPGLDPGQNELIYGGDTISDPAKLVVRWTPAYW